MSAQSHLDRIHELPCCLCGSYGVHAHHIGEGRTFGKRAQLHFAVIPLCPACHTGSQGVHGDKTMLRIVKKSELELLAETLETLYGD